ncbi:hypothetical protein Ga0100231_023755 [Opitutaceae bacterium TAV4]|nr:hypothetical protein Ga0100231_023755 [Opitutaceae bacterium TAV4]
MLELKFQHLAGLRLVHACPHIGSMGGEADGVNPCFGPNQTGGECSMHLLNRIEHIGVTFAHGDDHARNFFATQS